MLQTYLLDELFEDMISDIKITRMDAVIKLSNLSTKFDK